MYLCDRKATSAGKRETKRGTFPTGSKAGHLRLARQGTEVTFWAAEGAGEDYQELCRHDWGAMDVKEVAVRAYPGRSEKPVDLRITDFRVRDQSDPAPQANAAPGARFPWRLWLLAGLFGATVVGLLWTWRWRVRRDRRQRPKEPLRGKA